MPVFNREKIDFTKQKPFFGPELNVQRFAFITKNLI